MSLTKITLIIISIITMVSASFAVDYPIVDTGQEECYNASVSIESPSPGDPFYGQDAQFDGNTPSYTISGDSLTVYDNVTGLTWIRSPDLDGDGDIDADDKLTWTEVQDYPDVLNTAGFGGYNDWRVPTIKELYSLIKFNGQDISGYSGSLDLIQPFIDDEVFDYAYGDTVSGERPIDSQYASSNVYNEYTIPGVAKLFGVNFADGRIKGYDTAMPMGDKTFTFIAVRGNPLYGINDFYDNGDGTIDDSATSLMWQKGHSPDSLSWEDALEYAETLSVGGYDDWRLPNAKELQSIVDYTRSPGTSGAAIDPIFECASITNEAGAVDYPWFWTSTTHAIVYGGSSAAYVTFGRASGWMQLPGRTYYSYIDIHGAGAQRSDPKSGSYLDYYLGSDSLGNPVYGHGPQGDIIRVYNYARCVRDIGSVGIESRSSLPEDMDIQAYPNPFNSAVTISLSAGVGASKARPGQIGVEILDVSGRMVADLPVPNCDLGNSQFVPTPVIWSPEESIGSGVYFVKVANGNTSVSKKLIYLK